MSFTKFGFDEGLPEIPLPEPTYKLRIELVPETSWGSNLRKALSRVDWDKLRKSCYRQAGYRCEICGGKGPVHPVECHEVWEYEDIDYVEGEPLPEGGLVYTQTLKKLEALCPACHEVKHIGLAELRGRFLQALGHLMNVNGWESGQAFAHLDEARRLWADRSSFKWELDLSWLESHGVEIPSPPDEYSQVGEWEEP